MRFDVRVDLSDCDLAGSPSDLISRVFVEAAIETAETLRRHGVPPEVVAEAFRDAQPDAREILTVPGRGLL